MPTTVPLIAEPPGYDAELRVSEERYRRVLAMMPAAVYACDAPSGAISYYNEHAVRLWGRVPRLGEAGERFCACYKVWTLDGRFVPPEETPMALAIREGRAFRAQQAVVERPDGSRFVAELSIEPLRDANGRVTGAINVFHDVTARRAQDEKLRESEQQLRLALEAGRMGAWEWDIAANRVAWSPGLEALHGLPPGSFDGTFEAFRRDIHPEDLAEVERRIAHTFESGEEHRIEYRIVLAGGETKWVEGRGRLFRDPGGRPQRMVGVCADITERRRAEAAREETAAALALERERLEIALRTGRLGVYEWRVGDDEVWWSPETYALYGVDPASFRPTVAAFTALVHPADRDALWRKTQECLERREVFMHEYRVVPPDGIERWIYNCSRIGLDAAGNPVRITGVAADITERRRAEEALREADRRKDEFIAMLSHELRNPLAPLRSALDLMKLHEPPGADARVRAMMERQVAHMTRLVDDLLEASRISRGLLELKRAPLELAEVLRAAVESAEPLVREAGHRLELELPAGPLPVEGDAVRLAQGFANLLNNAARYTPRGGRIWLKASRAGGARALVSVRDDGAGFAPAVQPRLFEMFWRGPGSSGLGIGLALTRKLVEMHGGTIEARSEGEGRGAEFVVSLPLDATAARGMRKDTVATPSGLRVLVADDNRDAAESLAALLRALGNEVSLAYDGVEALEAARARRPHLILLDIGLPRLDGYGAARELRKDPATRAIRLVAITGWGQDDDRRRAREAGFDAHLVKPAELEALRRELGQVSKEAS